MGLRLRAAGKSDRGGLIPGTMTSDAGPQPPSSASPPQLTSYVTAGGIGVQRRKQAVDAHSAVENLIDALERRRGVLLSSNYDYPGRYTRWDLGLADPLLEISSRERCLEVRALCPRGELLLDPIEQCLGALAELTDIVPIERG